MLQHVRQKCDEASCCGESDANVHMVGLEDRLLCHAVLSARSVPGQTALATSLSKARDAIHRHEALSHDTAYKCWLQECRAAAQELQSQLEAAQRQADDMQVGSRVGTAKFQLLVAAI